MKYELRSHRVVVLAVLLTLFVITGAVQAATPNPQHDPPSGSSDLSGSSAARGGSAQPAAPYDCSRIKERGIDIQTNMHAARIMAACGHRSGAVPDGGITSGGSATQLAGDPAVLGRTDIDVILPDGTYPHVTQSEAMVSGHGTTVVVNYNDTRTAPACSSGTSHSSDGGATFQHAGQPFCSGHGTNYGDPFVAWNNRLGRWFAGDLALGCGGQGIALWTSSDGVSWTAGPCAHNGLYDDQPSMWVDNNPASPHYGRMYISWNDFMTANFSLTVTYSDNGTTWTPVVVYSGAPFHRNGQATGDLAGSGTAFITNMDEGGGGFGLRQNLISRSTDGGTTWTDIVMGPPFYPPGRGGTGYQPGMYAGGYWRYMGAGQPAAVGAVVHYAYSAGVQGTDPGNIMYTRSTDNGSTWSTPIQLNSDGTTSRAQWQPSLAATLGGGVFVGWYDERETTGTCTPGATALCYRRWGITSLDNGGSWNPDSKVGDDISPLPGPDINSDPNYAGDYNYDSSDGTNVYDTWTDGRVIIGGASQQDVFLHKIMLRPGKPPTSTPAVTGTPPTSTPTPTSTLTPAATGTVCGGSTGWSAGPNLPTTLARATGVYFSPNGRFYTMGGRTAGVGSEVRTPYEYTPGSPGSWTVKTAVYNDSYINNQACGVLTQAGTPYIFCVGGTQLGQSHVSAQVRRYDPAADTITALTSADDWPGDSGGSTLPGGFAVVNNKLYILGGNNLGVAATNAIYQFDPNGAAGSRWTLKSAVTPAGIMYAPTASIGGIIYVGGAAGYQTGSIIDTTTSFSYNPTADTIGAIATIPRATSDTRALNVGGKMWVLGGGFNAPNPSSELDIYDPSTNTWSVGSPFANPRHAFPADTDGAVVRLAGGFEAGNPARDMQISGLATPCSTATVLSQP